MGTLLNLVTPLHRSTPRDYLARMNDEKVECMRVARRYGRDYWDGDRRYGYGGYRYDGRWAPVAQALYQRYSLGPGSRILDVGCGKGYLLYELLQIEPRLVVRGIDVSDYALTDAPEVVRPFLSVADAAEPLPFADRSFDLLLSLGVVHNLQLAPLLACLGEFRRLAPQAYLLTESYRNEVELFNLQCWALTCESFFRPGEWERLFAMADYQGDYEFIYFE